MFKIKPYFPQFTKDKKTSTLEQTPYNNTGFNYTSTSWNRQSHRKERSIIDISRLVKLAEPRLNTPKQTMFTQTSPNFYTLKRQSPQNHKTFPLWNFNCQKPAKNNQFRANSHTQPYLSKNSTFYNWPKIEIKKFISKNHNTEENKENQSIPKIPLRKEQTKKCKTLIDEVPFFQKKKIKQKKQKKFDPQNLKSSDLASIYSSLYNMYQQVPFDEQEQIEPILVNLVASVKKQAEKQDVQKKGVVKERKSFGMKKLEFEKNLRKEIKSLTRDTDHILSLEFRDIREVNIR